MNDDFNSDSFASHVRTRFVRSVSLAVNPKGLERQCSRFGRGYGVFRLSPLISVQHSKQAHRETTRRLSKNLVKQQECV